MIISVTERGTFKRCRQQWDYSSKNRQNITPLASPVALSFGTLAHKVHEQWLDNLESVGDEVPLLVAKVGAEERAELTKRYVERIGVGPDDVEFGSFMEQYFLAQEMFTNYVQKWGTPLPEGLTLIATEQTIVVPIPGTEHQHLVDTATCNPEQCALVPSPFGARWLHLLEGTLDVLCRDGQGRLWIIDHKTFANHPKLISLQMNDQFTGYIWLGQQAQLGEIAGVIVDGMWKRERFDKRGKDRTLDRLFERTPITHTAAEIATFEQQLTYEALTMGDPDVKIFRTVPWLGCIDCAKYLELCNMEYAKEDASGIRARYVTRTDKDWQEEAEEVDLFNTAE